MSGVDLVQWLGAQYDVEAARATAAAEELGADWYYDDGMVLARHEDSMVATGSQDFLERERGVFIAEWDPARVLREIDGRRRTLLRCQEEMLSGIPRLVHFAQQTLREMALGYSHRPGYKEATDA